MGIKQSYQQGLFLKEGEMRVKGMQTKTRVYTNDSLSPVCFLSSRGKCLPTIFLLARLEIKHTDCVHFNVIETDLGINTAISLQQKEYYDFFFFYNAY